MLKEKNVYSSDNIRKAFYVIDKLWDMLDESEINLQQSNSNNILNLSKIKDEIVQERYKLQATKLEKTRQDRLDARYDLFIENISQAFNTIPNPEFQDINIEENEKQYVLAFSDVHFAANFKSYNNEYNCDEVVKRFNKLLIETKDYVQKNNITTLKVLNLADDIQGILRLKDLQLNEIPVVDAVVKISRIIANFLNELSSVCNVEYYHTGYANHSQMRPLGSKASALVAEDLGKVIGNYITDVLANNERIKVIFNPNSDYIKFEIFNFESLAMHGHQIKTPKTALKDFSNLHNINYIYLFVGHFHGGAEYTVGEYESCNKEVIIVPSFCGSDPYSDSLFLGSKAMAKIFEFDEKFGHTGTKNIILN